MRSWKYHLDEEFWDSLKAKITELDEFKYKQGLICDNDDILTFTQDSLVELDEYFKNF